MDALKCVKRAGLGIAVLVAAPIVISLAPIVSLVALAILSVFALKNWVLSHTSTFDEIEYVSYLNKNLEDMRFFAIGIIPFGVVLIFLNAIH